MTFKDTHQTWISLYFPHENSNCVILFLTMQLICVFIGDNVSQQVVCSSLEFSLPQWLEYLTSVWRVVSSIPMWNSEFFCVLLSSSYWLCFSFQISNDECWDESFPWSTGELHQQFIFCFMCSIFLSNGTDRMYLVGKSFTWFGNIVALAMQAAFCSLFLSCSLWNLGAL